MFHKAIASFLAVSPMHPPGPLTGLLCIAIVLRPKVLKFAAHDCKWFLDYNLELQVLSVYKQRLGKF